MKISPQSEHLMVGSGEVWFNRLDNDGEPTGYRHVGNVSKLEITPNITEVTSKSSMNAARAVRGRAVTETKMELAMTLSEFHPENLALATLGETGTAQALDASITDEAIPGKSVKGRWLDTGFVNITVTGVKVGATSHTLDDDYQVDAAAGLIYIMPDGDIADDSDVTWSGSCTASGTKVAALTQGRIEGALLYRASADQIGPKTKIVLGKVSVSPDGALGFLGDQFGEIGLKGEVLQDDAGDYGEITYLDDED